MDDLRAQQKAAGQCAKLMVPWAGRLGFTVLSVKSHRPFATLMYEPDLGIAVTGYGYTRKAALAHAAFKAVGLHTETSFLANQALKTVREATLPHQGAPDQ